MLIALTGGIGSGKSTVASEWVRLGATEVDADVLAREVVQPGSQGLEALRAKYGSRILDASGDLNRQELAKIIFSSSEEKKSVEAILHPLIRQLAKEKTKNIPGVVIYTIPLLVETSPELQFDKIVTVSCPEDVRKQRLLGRGMSEADASKRVRSQATDADRESIADLVIDSNCSLDELLGRARQAYKALTNG
jgi:dephospho-CoA kinase